MTFEVTIIKEGFLGSFEVSSDETIGVVAGGISALLPEYTPPWDQLGEEYLNTTVIRTGSTTPFSNLLNVHYKALMIINLLPKH